MLKTAKQIISVLFIGCITMAGLPQVQAQIGTLPLPRAFYPLRAEQKFPNISYAKYMLAESWDKSMHGRHGRFLNEYTTDSAGNITGWNFAEGRFPDTGDVYTTNLKKLDRTSHSFLEIPEPFSASEVYDGATITFWYKYDGGTPADHLLSTTYVNMFAMGRDLRLQTRRNNVLLNHNATIFDGHGWYFIAVNLNSVALHTYAYKYEEPYDRNAITWYHFADENSVSSFDPVGHNRYVQIMGTEFDGEMRDVRFFDQELTKDQIKGIRNMDYDWSQGTISTESQVFTGNFRYYPMGSSAKDVMHPGTEVYSSGRAYYERDRHGDGYGGVIFDTEVSRRTLNNPFDNGSGEDPYDPETGGFTVSMWVYAGVGHDDSPTHTIERPFDSSEIRYMQLYVYDEDKGHYIFGLNRVNDRLGTIRTALDSENNEFPWTFWYYDPAGFRNRQNRWLHVVYVQHPNWQKVYIEDQDTDFIVECEVADYDCWASSQMRYTYQGVPKGLNHTMEWGLGNRYKTDNDSPLGVIHYSSYIQGADDVRIYRWPMSAKEVYQLHRYERTENPDLRRGENSDNEIQ